jgi:flagellar hook-associated protein 1 FlgK
MASVVTQLNAALGIANIQFSNPAGNTLRVLDDGAPNLSNIDAASVTITTSTLSGGNPQVALFKDGGNLYTGAFLTTGAQVTGLAGRIVVNTAIIGDPAKLVQYGTSTPSGDTTRPDFLYAQLTSGTYTFSAQAGLGTTASPFRGSLISYAQQFTSAQGENASAAKLLAEGQDVVLSTLQQKFNATSGVNIDDEMAHLLALQNAYAANARVMGVVKEMYQALMNAT